jgi:ketosteroid isomerase-like protein
MRVVGIVVVAATVALTAACAHRAPPDNGDSGSVAQRQSGFFMALSSKDVDATVAFFADDAVLHVAGMPPIEGRTAIRQFYGNLFRFLSATTAAPETLHVSRSGDLAYSTGRASNEFQVADGLTAYSGKYVLVWTRDGGNWAIALYSVSSNQSDAAR